MKRVDFTKAVVLLIRRLTQDGYHPIIDYVKRSKEEQKRLFEWHLTKCDGEVKISKHQNGLAVDIYLVNEITNELLDWKAVDWKGYHEYWESLGGRPVIEWDLNHWEF